MIQFPFSENEVPYFKRPDSPSRQVHVKRVVEQMIAESVGNYRKVRAVIKEQAFCIYEGVRDKTMLVYVNCKNKKIMETS